MQKVRFPSSTFFKPPSDPVQISLGASQQYQKSFLWCENWTQSIQRLCTRDC